MSGQLEDLANKMKLTEAKWDKLLQDKEDSIRRKEMTIVRNLEMAAASRDEIASLKMKVILQTACC